MNKVFKLAAVLQKCGSGSERSAGKNMSIASVIYALLLVAGSGLLGFLGTKLPGFLPYIGGDVGVLISVFYLIGFTLVVVLNIPIMINQLYMSTDLPELLVMPFTALEIVMARIINISKLVVVISFLSTIPLSVGFMIIAGFDINLLIADVMAFISIPIISIAGLAVIVILVMSFIHSLRNRDHLKIIGGVLLMLILAVYYIFINPSSENFNQEAIGNAVNSTSKFTAVFFINPMLTKLMKGFDVLAFIEIVAVCTAFILAFVFVSKKLYLKGAINMQTTSSLSKAFSESELTKISAQKSAFRSFFISDFKRVQRNPGYLVQGFLYPLFLPILMMIMLFFSMTRSFSAEDSEIISEFISRPAVVMALGFAVSGLLSMTASLMNVLSASSLSREGETIYLISIMPIDFKQYIRAKKYVPLAISAAGSTAYIIIGGIAAVIMGYFPIWSIPYMLFVNISMIILFTCINVIGDIKNPSFSWSNEAEMLKTRLGAKVAVIFLVLMIVFIVGPIFAVTILADVFNYLIFLGLPVLMSCIAFVLNKMMYKLGVAKLNRL